MNPKYLELLRAAHAVRAHAYAPYSDFKVGAALLAEDGRVFVGCNVENAALSPTCCAERAALFAAVSAGARTFCAIAIVGGRKQAEPLCFPCGVCRQVLAEFCDDGMTVILENEEGAPVILSLGELLPRRFALNETK